MPRFLLSFDVEAKDASTAMKMLNKMYLCGGALEESVDSLGGQVWGAGITDVTMDPESREKEK